MRSVALRKNQSGAALVVGMILLMVLTVLAISGMNTATTELALAQNAQYFESAFQAAESGIEEALSRPDTEWDLTAAGVTIPRRAVAVAKDGVTPVSTVETTVVFQTTAPVLETDATTSMNTFEALHYDARADAEATRGATSRHRQGFYHIAPRSPTFGAPTAP
ncbi:MAG: PilX N-terminal domain-containing pilus assembly protein [Pseudomonadota bacterium]